MKEQINPFVVNNSIKILAVKKRGDSVIANQPPSFYVDKDKKANFYVANQSNLDLILFNELTSKGRDLMLYMMVHIQENKDYISLKLADVRRVTGISRNAIVTAIKSLKAANIITPKEQSVYWVNPHYIFKGNRIEYYRSINPELLDIKSVINTPNV